MSLWKGSLKMHKNSLYKTTTKGPEIRYIPHGNWRLVVLSWFARTFSFIINLNSDLDAFIVFVLAGIDMFFFFHRRVFIIDAIVNEACRAANVLLSAAVGLYLIVFSNIIIDFFFSYKLWVLVLLTRSNFNLTWLEPDLNSSGASGT